MRKLLIGLVLFIGLGGSALVWPYRIEQVTGVIANNHTGCTINVQNSSGWKSEGPPSAWHAERLEEPVIAGVAVYECGGIIGNRPTAMTLVAPDGRHMPDGCASSGDSNWCYNRFAAPPAADNTQHYRLLIQVRAGEPAQLIDITASRRIGWRSGGFDAFMSV